MALRIAHRLLWSRAILVRVRDLGHLVTIALLFLQQMCARCGNGVTLLRDAHHNQVDAFGSAKLVIFRIGGK